MMELSNPRLLGHKCSKLEMESAIHARDDMPAKRPKQSHLMVGAVAMHQTSMPTCTKQTGLVELATLFLETGQTVVVVLNEDSVPIEVMTEDDMLRAYFQGVPWDLTVGEWLCGCGKGNVSKLFRDPDATVVAACVDPVSAPASSPDVVGHDLLLRDVVHQFDCVDNTNRFWVMDERGRFSAVLSPLELARVISDRGESILAGDGEVNAVPTLAAHVMEPLKHVPFCTPGSTMQQLVEALLSSPARVVLVADESGVHGLASATDALRAFQQRACPSADAWRELSARREALAPPHCVIPSDLPVQSAAAVLTTKAAASAQGAGGRVRHLVVVEPDGKDVVGVLSGVHLARCRSRDEPRGGRNSSSRSTYVETLQNTLLKPVAPAKARRLHHRWHRRNNPNHLTVADVIAQRDTLTCFIHETLGTACGALVSSGRTAAVVIDKDSETVRGVLTENDILQAFCEGTRLECLVNNWLRGGHSRLPGFILPLRSVQADVTLEGVAQHMASIAEDRSSSFACHHLLVRDSTKRIKDRDVLPNSQPDLHLLSALDIASGLAVEVTRLAEHSNEGPTSVDVLTVKEAMKLREIVPTCLVSDTIRCAFQTLCASKQNCLLVLMTGNEVVDSGSDNEKQAWRPIGHCSVYDIITTDDVLRAFSGSSSIASAHFTLPASSDEVIHESEHMSDTMTIGSWLHSRASNRVERLISCDAPLVNATAAMCRCGVHHLLAVSSDGSHVVGVVSALDIVCAFASTYAHERELEVEDPWATQMVDPLMPSDF